MNGTKPDTEAADEPELTLGFVVGERRAIG